MDDISNVKKSLEIILKEGDLYSAIARKMNVFPRKHPFIKSNILFFSRIAFLGVVLSERIANIFFDVERIKEAQKTIRKALGVDVDILSFDPELYSFLFINPNNEKKLYRHISILYEDDSTSIEHYVQNLKKIFRFCENYDIDDIYLGEDDVLSRFYGVKIDNYMIRNLKFVLNSFVNLEGNSDKDYIFLSRSELAELLDELEHLKVDNIVIKNFGEEIKDASIKKEVDNYLKNGNLNQLKLKVSKRLESYLNSGTPHRDRQHGKVYTSAIVSGKFLKVTHVDAAGNILNNSIVTLYEFLGVKNLKLLNQKYKSTIEDKELYLLSIFHLYLNGEREIDYSLEQEKLSFFDRLYVEWKEKKATKTGMYTKLYQHIANGLNIFISLLITFGLVSFLYFGGSAVNLIEHYVLGNANGNSFDSIKETVISPYVKSLEIEKKLLEEAARFSKKFYDGKPIIEFFHFTIDYLRDMFTFESLTGDTYIEEENLAMVTPIDREAEIPEYYSYGYASNAEYNKGVVHYLIEKPKFSFQDMENVEELFSIEYEADYFCLSQGLSGPKFNPAMLFYPLGEDYVVSRITIYDEEQPDNRVSIDYNRAQEYGSNLSYIEAETIYYMKNPKIICYYGISDTAKNSFVQNIKKEGSYLGISSSQAREAILDGLGLRSDASLEDIYDAIKSKKYSMTPLEDAKISNRIKNYDEEEYYEKIAGLDSTICNLAASLMVAVDDELIYTSGFCKDSDSDVITTLNGHSWAMDKDGNIVDANPDIDVRSTSYGVDSSGSIEKETVDNKVNDEKETDLSSAVSSIIEFGKNFNLGLVTIAVLIAVVFEKKFGKKVKIKLNLERTNNLLKGDYEKSYSLINDILYGGMNVPVQQKKSDFIDTISNEFYGLSIDELNELKKLLRSSEIDSETTISASKLVSLIPFIREHPEEIKHYINKPKK